ncbi:MAG: TSUP family transporter [Desulfotalea sp.]
MENFDLTYHIIAVLFMTGTVAGLVDSIAGGGGLIALPMLISLGLPPQIALGTNKLQGCFGTFSAACNFIKKGQVSIKEAGSGVLFTLIGAGIGAWLVQQLPATFMETLIPFLLIIIFIYTLLSPKLGQAEQQAKISIFLFSVVFGISLGFYDGFFGPGTGAFWTVACMWLMGMNMTKASGYTKIMNFTSNITALTIFMIGGNVLYSAGLVMAVGQVIGALIGSNLAIKKGTKFIRPIFLIVVLLTIVKLFYQSSGL